MESQHYVSMGAGMPLYRQMKVSWGRKVQDTFGERLQWVDYKRSKSGEVVRPKKKHSIDHVKDLAFT